jgi:hypothetical protein
MSLRNILFATSVALLALVIGIWTNHNHRTPASESLINSNHQYGLFVLAPGIHPVVECVKQSHYMTVNGVITVIYFPLSIVAIHGLDGHPTESWTAANGKLWLRDFLPDKIPHARIMSYGYDAYTRNRRQLSDQTVYDHAEALVAALASMREETNVRHYNSHMMFDPSHSHADTTTAYRFCRTQSRWNCIEICRLHRRHR